jgi:hypothetical protein
MSVMISLTDTQIFTALRAFLLAILPSGVDVIRSQVNRVPEPKAPDFVLMTETLRERLETNITTYSDGYPGNPQTRSDMHPVKVTIQLDVHGPNSADNAQIISTLFRSDVAINNFVASGVDVTPLYTGEPRQMPFTNAEQQTETRWIVEVVMQCNPVITSPQDFADQVSVTQNPLI